jgi:4-amino-4-deoxy-L-arabinose transferase-like glycosyltransferase
MNDALRGLVRWFVRPFPSMVLVAASILFAGLGQGDIRIDGPIYAWIAKYMLLSGDWLNLYYDHGQTPYFNKPPFQFWLMALAFKALGPSTFSAKLVSVLFALGCVIMVYAIARLRFDAAIAATAGVVLATTYPFIRNSASVRLDAGVTFFFLAALYAGTRMIASSEHRTRDWVELGAACGFALMVKSGTALLCLPIIATAWAWRRRWDLFINWRGAVAAAVCVVIVLPWYWHQYATWGQAFIDQHFRNQMLGRFEAETFGTTAWYAYLRELAIAYWPWLPFALYGGWRLYAAERGSAVRRAEDRMFLAWAVISLVILHVIPRKYDRYLLLVFPVLAIFAAWGLSQWRFWMWWERRALPNLGWIVAIVFVGLQVFNVRLHTLKYPELAQSVSAMNESQARAGKARAAVYAVDGVGVSVQCAIRFYTNAKVAEFDEKSLRAGDIVVLLRERESELGKKLPRYETLARGKTLLFLRVAAD